PPRLSLTHSEPRQALGAVVGDRNLGDLLERTVRLAGVADELRGVAVDLVQVGAVRREPIVARSAGHGWGQTSSGAIARYLRARGVLRDLQAPAVDVKATDVAVAEVRREDEPVIRRNGEPAQLGRQAPARVDLHQRADVDLAVSIDGAYGAPVADGISEDE